MPVVKSSAKGQVVIPAELRKKIGLRPGGQVLVYPAGDGRVIIEPVPDDPIEAACGMFQDGGPSLVQALLKERREERAREEKKIARLFRRSRLSRKRARSRRG